MDVDAWEESVRDAVNAWEAEIMDADPDFNLELTPSDTPFEDQEIILCMQTGELVYAHLNEEAMTCTGPAKKAAEISSSQTDEWWFCGRDCQDQIENPPAQLLGGNIEMLDGILDELSDEILEEMLEEILDEILEA